MPTFHFAEFLKSNISRLACFKNHLFRNISCKRDFYLLLINFRKKGHIQEIVSITGHLKIRKEMGEKSQWKSKKIPGLSSPFSLEERIFIVNKFVQLKSIRDVKRVFRLRFTQRIGELFLLIWPFNVL